MKTKTKKRMTRALILIGALIVLPLGMGMTAAYCERGYLGFGGELFLPLFAVIFYLLVKTESCNQK